MEKIKFKSEFVCFSRVRPKIPVNKEMEPLLERDRDEKKFDIFLSYHRSNLLLGDLKIFLPFTINLDPYIKKVIKGRKSKRLNFIGILKCLRININLCVNIRRRCSRR